MTGQKATSYSPTTLAGLAYRLPKPIVHDAAAGDDHQLPILFDSEEAGILPFGERLILTAGLFVSSLFAETTIRRKSDARLPNIIRPILLSRSYGIGMALSILQRLPVAGKGLNIALPPLCDSTCLARFVGLHRLTYANTFRALHDESIEDLLVSVLDYLSFLRDFEFSETESDMATYRGRPIRLWPFIRWNGKVLSGLRESLVVDSGEPRLRPLPNRLVYVREDFNCEPPYIEDSIDVSAAESIRLAEVAQRVGISTADTEDAAPVETVETFIPLLSDNYSHMQELLDLVYKNANQKTKHDWVEQFLKKGALENPSKSAVRAAMRDRSQVENAILGLCLEDDPVTLLADYFERESEDEDLCLTQLAREQTPAVLKTIDDAVRVARDRIEPLHVGTDQELDRLLRNHRARLVAFEVARLLGFHVRNVVVRDAVEDYIDRLKVFLRVVGEHPDEDRVNRGVMHSFRMCEEALGFIFLFHRAASSFDSSSPTGLSIESRSTLLEDAQKKRGLGQWIGKFQQLCEKYERGIGSLGSRRNLASSARPRIVALNELNAVRNTIYAHGQHMRDPPPMPSIRDRLKLLDSVLRLLEWLRKPYPERPGTFNRIYPAVLHLNVLTMNRCGVTTVRYILRGRKEDEIRLYTQQPVSTSAGVFYGIPAEGKGNADLWVDPVLFAADAFEAACQQPLKEDES